MRRFAAKCVPSGSGSYFVTAVKSADVAGMSDREILDAQLAALNAEIDKSAGMPSLPHSSAAVRATTTHRV